MYKPTLLIPRGLGFPGGRFQRGFDSSHVAAKGLKAGHGISAVAARTTFLNLLNGKKGQFGGGTPRHDGIIGPVFDGVASNDGFNTGNAAITDDNVVLAAIVRTVTSGSSASHFICTSDSQGSGWGLDTTATGAIQLTNIGNNGGNFLSTISVANGGAYFVAASGTESGSGVGNFVVVNLANGQIQWQARGPATSAASSGASNGNYGLCSLAGTGSANAYMAAAMWGPSFLTMPQLLAWAEDPWSFWYPRPAPLEIFTDSFTAAAAAAGPGLVAPSIFRPGQGPTRGLSTRRSTDIPAPSGTTASGDGAAAGVGTAQAVGAALFSGQGASSGVGAATGVGAGLDAATAASAGIGAAQAVGAAVFAGQGASSGASTVQAVGASLFSAVAASAGTGAAAATGRTAVMAVASASGVGAATASSGIIPADRLTTWQPGVTYNTYAALTSLVGHGSTGIPSRTTIFTTINPSGDTTGVTDHSNIQGAINSCPSGQVVKLAVGVFTVSGLVINKDITLRGSGSGANLSTGINGVSSSNTTIGTYTVDATATQLIHHPQFDDAIISVGNATLPATVLDRTPLAANASHGDTQITLTAIPTGLAVGDLVALDHTTVVFAPQTTASHSSGVSVLNFSSVPSTVTVGLQAYSNNGTTQYLQENTTVVSKTSTTVTLSKSLQNTMPSGSYVWFDTDPEVVWNNNFVPPSFPGNPEWGWFVINPYNARQQLIEVAAINTGTKVITSVTPIRGNFLTSLGAQISRIDQGTTPWVYGAGVEDMFLFNGRHGNVNFAGCAYSWLKNVDSGWGLGPDSFGTCYRCEIRDSFLHESPDINPGGAGYRIGMAAGTTDCLIENNAVWYGNKVMVMQGCGPGNVIGYNCMDDAFGASYPGFPEAGLNAAHYVGTNFTLFEGNYCFNYAGDTFWGNEFKNLCFRNWFSGLRARGGPLATYSAGNAFFPSGQEKYLDMGGRYVVNLQAYCLSQSFVGNVLGYSGQATISDLSGTPTWVGQSVLYEDITNTSQVSDLPMWIGGNNQAGNINIWHNNWWSTLLRNGNWDWFTSTQIWYAAIGDTGTTSTGTSFTLPNSMYLPGGGASAPAFWGATTWPWVDPSTGTCYTLPAKARLETLLALTPIPPGNQHSYAAPGNVATAAGVGTATAVGRSLANSVGASAGTGAAAGIGLALAPATGATAGVGAATATGASLVAAIAATSGTGTALGVGSFTVPGNVGTSAGIGAATGIGAWTADSIAASAGAGTALGVGQASGLISAVGSSAGASIVLGVSPAVEQPAGGAGYVMRSHSFTRKRWEELQALIAAEKAAAAKAEKVGNPARAEALAEAAGKAADAIAALGAVEEQDAYSADMARLAGLLEGATKAKKVADSIREAKEAALLAEKLQAEADEEYEIMLLLDDGPEAAREMERIVAMMAAITGGR